MFYLFTEVVIIESYCAIYFLSSQCLHHVINTWRMNHFGKWYISYIAYWLGKILSATLYIEKKNEIRRTLCERNFWYSILNIVYSIVYLYSSIYALRRETDTVYLISSNALYVKWPVNNKICMEAETSSSTNIYVFTKPLEFMEILRWINSLTLKMTDINNWVITSGKLFGLFTF